MRLVAAVCALALVVAGCDRLSEATGQLTSADSSTQEGDDADRADERREMVSTQLEARNIDDEAVLEAMRTVPRHEYVPSRYRRDAYRDGPLPIGHDQTISQPYIVALMTQLLDVSAGDRVLEIGTGSGYQAAVLAELDTEVYSIEIICDLAEQAEEDLQRTGYGDVQVLCGDGYEGWPDHAPFDRVIVTAAPPEIPDALIEQLKVGGKMVVPVGEDRQRLQVIEKTDEDAYETTSVEQVRFVPMVPGEE